MRSDWILDVLSDLKNFAQANDLLVLAEQLDDATIVALAEIAGKLENDSLASEGQKEDDPSLF